MQHTHWEHKKEQESAIPIYPSETVWTADSGFGHCDMPVNTVNSIRS